MRKIIITAALLASSQAFGQTQYYYGSGGQMQGYSNQVGNSTYYYGSGGQSLGYSNSVGNNTYYYGPGGQSQGYTTQPYGGAQFR